MRLIFWGSVALVVYVYLGYPALLAVRRRAPVVRDLDDKSLPMVTLLIAAYNEETVLREKLENSLALDYPRNRLEIVVASDGSVDSTNDIARSFAAQGVVLHQVTPRGGKTRALNLVFPHSRGSIVVLSDANTMYRHDAIRKLVRHFADASVGGVSGDVRLVDSATAYAQSEGIYYKYERFIQQRESGLGAIVGADGAMYAIRRELFRIVPSEVVVDDFVISMTVARLGFKVRYEAEAIAIERGTLTAAEEFRRKMRVVAGGIQALRLGIGLPHFSQPVLVWCYASHKLLRWLMPCFLLCIAATTLGLASNPFYRAVLCAQLAFYGAAAVHPTAVRQGWSSVATNIPYYFCLVNGAALAGVWRGIRGKQGAAWSRTSRQKGGAAAASVDRRTGAAEIRSRRYSR